MQRTLLSLFATTALLAASANAAEELMLRLLPSESAPVIARVVATEKVILETAPVADAEMAQLGWRKLRLPTPFEGYVPKATVSEDKSIIAKTPVQYLPTQKEAIITLIEKGDSYEIIGYKGEWAAVRLTKDITGYFLQEAAPPKKPSDNTAKDDAEDIIMVAPSETQAREKEDEERFAKIKNPRLLTGTLVREIKNDGSEYPIRLRSPEGRFISFADFSGIYIPDLKPYLEQKVYLRGQIHPIKTGSNQLVILVEEIRLAE